MTKDDLKNFDFSVLWQDEQEGGLLSKVLPFLGIILNLITLIIVWRK